MRIRFSLILIVTSITVIYFLSESCKKSPGAITIHGNIFDPMLKKNVAGASVTIAAQRVSGGAYNSNFQEVASTTSDVNGNYSFEIPKEKVNKYCITIKKSWYFDMQAEMSGDILKEGEINIFNYSFYPEGWIKLYVKNTLPYDSLDLIAYNYDNGTLSCSHCCSDQIVKGYGTNYEQTSLCRIYGNQNIGISWVETKNKISVLKTDSIYCTAFDTTSYQIFY